MDRRHERENSHHVDQIMDANPVVYSRPLHRVTGGVDWIPTGPGIPPDLTCGIPPDPAEVEPPSTHWLLAACSTVARWLHAGGPLAVRGDEIRCAGDPKPLPADTCGVGEQVDAEALGAGERHTFITRNGRVRVALVHSCLLYTSPSPRD